jgi:hypothetical protein
MRRADHANTGSVEPSHKIGGEVLIEFDRGQACGMTQQHVRCQPRAGSEFEYVVTKRLSVEHPGQQRLLHVVGPLGARAQGEVPLIHGRPRRQCVSMGDCESAGLGCPRRGPLRPGPPRHDRRR